MKTKICTRCKKELPATRQHFSTHSPTGLSSRCKNCLNELTKERRLLNPEKYRLAIRKSEHKRYHANPEKARLYAKNWKHQQYRKNTKGYNLAMFKKRAGSSGLTSIEWEEIFNAQGRCCAICETTECDNWNTDHMHIAGPRIIRFILCGNCNRGLGCFKDDPVLLRKAADKLEEFPLSASFQEDPIYNAWKKRCQDRRRIRRINSCGKV